MADKTYNGWTNYETWCVKLWIDNEQSDYLFWRENAQDVWENAQATEHWTREDSATFALADAVKDWVEENAPNVTGMYADLLNAAISEVDWREIAEAMLEDVDKAEDATAASEDEGE